MCTDAKKPFISLVITPFFLYKPQLDDLINNYRILDCCFDKNVLLWLNSFWKYLQWFRIYLKAYWFCYFLVIKGKCESFWKRKDVNLVKIKPRALREKTYARKNFYKVSVKKLTSRYNRLSFYLKILFSVLQIF